MIFSRVHLVLCEIFLYLSFANASEQKPLLEHDAPSTKTGTSTWNLNFSSEAPHYFASVYGLLQQWPNTFFPNGHSIVPCEIPPFTNLYHGRMDARLPPSPEWVAFDSEMSYGIMGGTRNSHMLTYQTTRSAKCIYFDGESATLFGAGQLDSQMLHIFGNTSGPPHARGTPFPEGWGGDTKESPSLRLLSHLNVSAPLLGEQVEVEDSGIALDLTCSEHTSKFPLPKSTGAVAEPSTLPGPDIDWDLFRREPFQTKNWRRGETRVKLSTCGLLNYYDPVFESAGIPRATEEQKALNLTSDGSWTGPGRVATRFAALQSLTRRRRLHNLQNITSVDAAIMRANSEWVMRTFLDSQISPAPCSTSSRQLKVRGYDIKQPEFNLGVDLSHEEALLKWAVEETMGGICSVIVEVGLAVEGRLMSEFNTPLNSSTALLTADMRQDVQHWAYGIEELMAWLGWAGEWISCDKKCDWDESCVIPMWPLIHWVAVDADALMVDRHLIAMATRVTLDLELQVVENCLQAMYIPVTQLDAKVFLPGEWVKKICGHRNASNLIICEDLDMGSARAKRVDDFSRHAVFRSDFIKPWTEHLQPCPLLCLASPTKYIRSIRSRNLISTSLDSYRECQPVLSVNSNYDDVSIRRDFGLLKPISFSETGIT
ncbi:uncharacterized protein L3040_005111 [Drepanopeziza brunnea f. sp. 'multigermtubi']|uniref:uncharacterized protein n=1 Tax=Drepanopeziza brunnea f. sp. 'multigermtubi' TaxID=698441 RepID=UPI00238A42EF|nr:hypothetical protein L3040_005111 [Drepanopeziza brunnea f. sp. 'multigermtubi']